MGKDKDTLELERKLGLLQERINPSMGESINSQEVFRGPLQSHVRMYLCRLVPL